jgi:hypothetical protein
VGIADSVNRYRGGAWQNHDFARHGFPSNAFVVAPAPGKRVGSATVLDNIERSGRNERE